MRIVQNYLRVFRPRFLGILTRMIYSGKNVKFGRRLSCDGIPKILVDRSALVHFSDDVVLRKHVEIRSHDDSRIIIANNARIDRGVRLLAANNAKLEICARVRIGLYSVLNGGDSIMINANCLISGFVYLQTSMHGYRDPNTNIIDQGYDHAPIELKKDCWLGAHVVVMPGVILGEGVVVGSNAVVKSSFNSNSVVGGIPAKILKNRA